MLLLAGSPIRSFDELRACDDLSLPPALRGEGKEVNRKRRRHTQAARLLTPILRASPMASRTRRPPLTVKPIVQVLPLKYTVPRPLAMTHHLAARHHAQTIHPNKARLTIQTEVIARLIP